MTKIDNIELDETNVEFNYAYDFVKHTEKLVYLTGKAGTGKTTFLKYLRENTSKNTVVLAPTGIAAINAGGQTIHSFFQLPFGPFIPNDKRLRISKSLNDPDDTTIYSTFKYREDKRLILEKLELLIIDEISMVRCDTLDVIDKILRVFRRKISSPFGGVQVVLIGDTFQLPPIADFEQWEILKDHYESPFFFSSNVYINNKPVYIELKKIYRQKEQEFINLLNKIRVDQVTDSELDNLNKKVNPSFSPSDNNYIIISTTNAIVKQTNAVKLAELNTDLKVFEGEIVGSFPKDGKGNYVLPTEANLHLKVGAQVMILKNDLGEFKRYYNGKIGKVASLYETAIVIEFPDSSKVQIEKASWNSIQYSWNKEKRKIEEKIIGTFIQYPLKLAWAITVHKSQGLTFENVFADLSSAFEDGQVYVALSRCTSYSGLVLKSQIPRSKIRTNSKVIEFAKTETPSTLLLQELDSGKADFYYKKAREELKLGNINSAYEYFIRAIKFRNDIETEDFAKYIVIKVEKILNELKYYKENYWEKVRECESLNLHVEETNANWQEYVIGLCNENEELKNNISVQNNQLEIIHANIKQLEALCEKQQKEIATLEYDKIILEKYKNKAKGLLLKLQDMELEIKRLEAVKWYEKLLRRK